jgi:hypothetical protein
MSVLGTIVEGKQQRNEGDAQLTQALSSYLSAQQAPARQSIATPDVMRTTASLFLARLEDHEDLSGNDEALGVFQNYLRHVRQK